MIVRPSTPADTERVATLVVDDPVGAIGADRYRDELARGQVRPGWT